MTCAHYKDRLEQHPSRSTPNRAGSAAIVTPPAQGAQHEGRSTRVRLADGRRGGSLLLEAGARQLLLLEAGSRRRRRGERACGRRPLFERCVHLVLGVLHSAVSLVLGAEELMDV